MLSTVKRALLAGIGAYIVAVLFAAYRAIAHPESYIHFSPLQGFGINLGLAIVPAAMIAVGAAVGLLAVRSRPSLIAGYWFVVSGALVAVLVAVLPSLPSIVGECPAGEVCNPYDWSQSFDWLRGPLLALATIVLLSVVAAGKGSPPNTSLERTRER